MVKILLFQDVIEQVTGRRRRRKRSVDASVAQEDKSDQLDIMKLIDKAKHSYDNKDA